MDYNDIEKVIVNGMTMYKLGARLFLTENDAKDEVIRSKREELVSTGCIYNYPDYRNLIYRIHNGDLLHGRKL